MTRRKTAAAALVLLAFFSVAFRAAQEFDPPRTAVVDISEVFESYQKKLDRQEVLNEQSVALEAKFKELDGKIQQATSSIQLLEPGPKQDEKVLEKTRLEIERNKLRSEDLKKLRETQIRFLKELREEIAKEIETYREAFDLDLILEKSVTADVDPKAGGGFRWPIVHAVKPELDITGQILSRLNDKYQRQLRSRVGTKP